MTDRQSIRARAFSYLENHYNRFSERQQGILYCEILGRVMETTKYSQEAVENIYKRVIERGFDRSTALATIDLLDLDQRT